MRKLLIFPLILSLFLTLQNTAFATDIPTINRLAGSDRYETAYQIAKAGWSQADNAILAYGENFPDALAAVPLSKKLDAPILLTNNDSLNPKTVAALQELKVKTVYIVGGTGIISVDVENALRNFGYAVKRLAGQDRYETAIKIAYELGNVKNLFLVNGDDYADALTIGPISATAYLQVSEIKENKVHNAIILVPKDNITSSIKDYINSTKSINYTVVIGGQDLVSDYVANQFPNFHDRITGSDKYNINIKVLNYYAVYYKHDASYLATGENFADAMTGGAYVAKNESAMILVKDDMPVQTDNYIRSTVSDPVTVFGGEGVIPFSLLNNVLEKLNFGQINSQQYTNDYFGLTATIPNGWVVDDNIKRTQELYSFDKSKNNSTDASRFFTVYLLSVSSPKNLKINIMASKNAFDYKNGEENLKNYKKIIEGNINYIAKNDIQPVQIDGDTFYSFEYELTGNDLAIIHKRYTTIKKGYILNITLQYSSTNTDIAELDRFLASIKINP